MKALTDFSTPPQPRFNAWRLVALIVCAAIILAIPLEIKFFMDLRESKINLGEVVFLSKEQAYQRALLLKKRIEVMQADSARMASKIEILERNSLSVQATNRKGTQILLIKPYGRKQAEFKSFGAWAVDGMRYYRESLNQLYKSQGINHKIE